MKTFLSVCALAGVAAAAQTLSPSSPAPGQTPPSLPPPSEDGRAPRYQLLSGHDSITGQSYPRVFRIDTFTGQTWILRPRPVPGKDTMTAVWERLDEAPEVTENKNAEIEGDAAAK